MSRRLLENSPRCIEVDLPHQFPVNSLVSVQSPGQLSYCAPDERAVNQIAGTNVEPRNVLFDLLIAAADAGGKIDQGMPIARAVVVLDPTFVKLPLCYFTGQQRNYAGFKL